MGDSLIILDTQDYIVALNPAAQRLLGKDPEALVGAKLREVFDFWPSLCQAVSDGALKTVEERCELGGMRHFQIHLTPLRDPRQRPLGKVILLHDMTEQKQAAARLLEQQKALAILTERDRISRELHDGQGQIWGYFNMQLEAARSLIARNNAAGAAELLAQLAGVVRTVHAGIRESIDGLQTAAAAAGDLLQRLSEYLDWFGRNYGIRTELAVAGESLAGKLSPVTEAQLLRIVQEALANAKKHANPSRILVTVAGGAGRATITVEDDGCGFEPDPGQRNRGSYGLKIMRERAEDIGGELRVESAVGSGTRVTVSVRLE
ncbi:PAS domain S-box-containing protein [Hydrogenispora ethanolica]|uniref:histidine kinase n=2 Tax=Hydrogenispora ethanolica TaxID=1082276 RepID=A0A4R1RXN1_HYDET|nr:PAS domain S-box-containing protein [Hydrogenispora ethanolica]